MKNTALICLCTLAAACAASGTDSTAGQVSPDIASMVDERFPRIDFNGDGLITPYEHKESLKADFAKHYDTDGDGTLKLACTKADFSEKIQNSGPHHPLIRQCLNTDVSTVAEYSFDDFFAAHTPWWKSTDANSDDFISREEFAAAAMAK